MNLRDTAALVLGRYLDVLAWNAVATSVIKGFATVRRQERNFLRMLFLDPEVRNRFVDSEPGRANDGRLPARCSAIGPAPGQLDRRTVPVRLSRSTIE